MISYRQRISKWEDWRRLAVTMTLSRSALQGSPSPPGAFLLTSRLGIHSGLGARKSLILAWSDLPSDKR